MAAKANRWFVAAVGRGTSLTAFVYGPYTSRADFLNHNPGTAGVSFQIVGNQDGYPTRAEAQIAANNYNAGGQATTNPNQKNPGQFSPQGITNRDQQAGGTVGSIPNPLNWLSSLGGLIASGIESGVVSILKDLWNVVYPALEILAGVVVVIIVLGFAFKDDLIKLAPLAAAAL